MYSWLKPGVIYVHDHCGSGGKPDAASVQTPPGSVVTAALRPPFEDFSMTAKARRNFITPSSWSTATGM